MKRILITGASGMLGATLADKWQGKFDVYGTDKDNFQNNPARNFVPFDLLDQSYDELLERAEPDVIVHCAAITNVDYCEEHPDETMAVSCESVDRFLKFAPYARLIFISSDAVFPDGIHMATEKDETGAENVYGRSKELGERFILKAGGSHCAIRTTIVGKNINPSKQGFVEWIVNSVKDGKEIALFDDVLFTPITIWHLAEELECVIESDVSRSIHIAGRDAISKYDFGRILCEKLGLNVGLIRIDSIDNFNFRAKRSKDQTLDSSYYESISHRNLPNSQDTFDLLVKHFVEHTYGRI